MTTTAYGLPTTFKVYSKPGCQKCRLTAQGLGCKTIEASEGDLARFRAAGIRSMPVVQVLRAGMVIDEWSGLRMNKIREWKAVK